MSWNKHIVFISPGFPSDEGDFLCTPYLQDYFLALRAARPDWRISIVAMQYPYRTGHYQWHGLDVYALGGRNRRIAKPWVWRQCQQKLATLDREQRIDVLHAFWLGEAAQAALNFAKNRSIHTVLSAMGQDVFPENRYLKRLNLHAATLIALSEFSANLLLENGHHAADAIVPFGMAAHDLATEESLDRPIDILAVGSLDVVKRPDRFLRVVGMLRDEFPDLRAVWIGEGPLQPEVEHQVEIMGLKHHVSLPGLRPRTAVLAAMSQAKVFLHCSRVEGMGLVLAEALGRGCHLVSTPVGIAQASEKCSLSTHTYGLAQAAAAFLKTPVDFAPRNPFPIADTLQRHLEIYDLDK